MNAHRFSLGLGLFLMASAAVATTPATCGLAIEQPWVRAAPPGAMMMAGYATLTNSCAKALVVASATAGDFGDISIHETVIENGVSRMRPLPHLLVPAKGQVVLAPGGGHLMLMQPRRALAEGDKTRVDFVLADGRHVGADFPVRREAPPSPGR